MYLEQIENGRSVSRSSHQKMMHKMNPARQDREDERRMLPCRNFLDGFCPRGSRCRFYHPLPSSLPTVIRVPNLPSSFQQNNHFGQYPLHGGHHSLFSLSPTSSRSFLGLSPKLGSGGLGAGLGTPGVVSGSGRYVGGINGFSHGFGGRSVHIPTTPTYSEYEMAYAQEMELQKEKQRRAAEPQPEPEETMQNTVFSHIDWKMFLTPGARPPPPTHVPYMSNSPGKSPVGGMDSLESLIRSAGNAQVTTSPVSLSKASTFFEDHLSERPQSEFGHPTVVFPSGRKAPTAEPPTRAQMPLPFQPTSFRTLRELSPPEIASSSKALSAREELQFKVKQIAKELASEPAQHVQSLDTFFRNYTFESIPTAPSSEQDLVGSSDPITDGALDEHQLGSEEGSDLHHDHVADEEKETKVPIFNPKVPAFSSSSDSGICQLSVSGDSMEGKSSDPEESTSDQTPPSSS